MNITKILTLLTEGRDVNEINEKLKGKVDTHVLETMGPLMKKGKYDNIAMAIFDALQNWNDEWDKEEKRNFLIKRPKLVYAALKEAGKGNSNFNPELELRHFRFDEEEPMKFWAAYRSGEKRYKEKQKAEKKITFGLPQARVKELPESFIFFPRNFKLDFDNLTFNVNDLNKQYEDLRALSQQMADRDTSGSNRAKKNHWCVASSDSAYYSGKMYKGGHPGGLFIIIVNKNEDGSPDWNHRWLLWIQPDGKWEFANKFNEHDNFKYSLPESTVDFIENKVIARLGGAKGDKSLQALKDRAKHVYWSKDDKKRVNINSPIFKNYIKILRFLRAKYNERHGDIKTNGIMGAVKEAFNKALNWVEGKPMSALAIGEIEVPAGDYNFKFRRRSKAEDRNGKPIDLFLVDVSRKGNNERAEVTTIFNGDEIKQIAADPMAIKKIKPWSYRDLTNLDPSFKSKAYVLTDPTPSKKVKDALLNNKLALQYYEDIATENEPTVANDEIHEFFIGPHFLVTVMEGDNRVSVLKKPWSYNESDTQLIGDLRDKDIVEKVKKAYDKLVAEGPEKV